MKRLITIGVLLGSVATAAPYKLATLLPMTGVYANNGVSLANGAALALSDLQPQLKAAQLDVSLQKLDDQGSVETATRLAQTLLQDPDVMGVLNSYTSGVTVPVSDVLNKGNLVQLSVGTAGRVTDRGLANINRVVARNDAQGKVMAQYLYANKNVRRVYILSDATTYGDGLADDFAASARQTGIRVLGQLSVSKRSGFQALARQIAALKPDYLYFGGEYDSALSVLGELRKDGVQTPIAGGDTLNLKDFFKASATLQKGLVFTDTFGQLRSFANWIDFDSRYRAMFQSAPDALSLFGYDSAKVILQGMLNTARQSGPSLTRQTVEKNVRLVQTNGVTGPIAFDAKGDRKGAPVFVIDINPQSSLPQVLQIITHY